VLAAAFWFVLGTFGALKRNAKKAGGGK